MRFKKDTKGRWYRELQFSGDDKPTYQRVDPQTEARLAQEFPDEAGTYELNTEFKGMSKEGFKDMMRDTMSQIISDDLLQDRKDEESLRMQKDGGGVVPLYQPDMRGGKSIYEDITDALDDLHDREARGDQKAKQQLDGLFEILGKKMMTMTGKTVNIMGCPRCSFGIDTLETTVCPKCGLDLEEMGWKRYGEIYGGKRR